MRCLVVTQRMTGVPKNGIIAVAPLSDNEMVQEAMNVAQTRADRGKKVAIKVATLPGAKLCHPRPGKPYVPYFMGHDMVGWRSVRSRLGPSPRSCNSCFQRKPKEEMCQLWSDDYAVVCQDCISDRFCMACEVVACPNWKLPF